MDALAAGEERAAKALHAALATDGGLR